MELITLIDSMSELSNYLNPYRGKSSPYSGKRYKVLEIPKEEIADKLHSISLSDETNPSEHEACESHKSVPIFPVPDIDSEEPKGSREINPLQAALNKVISAQLPEPFFSNALYSSKLNSALIHNPGFFVDFDRYVTDATEAEEAHRKRLVEGFDIMSFLEQSLRSFIPARLKVVHGDFWWKRGVPEDVKNGCAERQMKEILSLEISHHFIYYAYIHDYRKIITRNDNWQKVFAMVFDNKAELETCFTWVSNVRNSIAHARPVFDNDYLMFVAGAKWIQLRIQRWTGKAVQDSKKKKGIFGKFFDKAKQQHPDNS